jgi:hypothetical protein
MRRVPLRKSTKEVGAEKPLVGKFRKFVLLGSADAFVGWS